MNLIQKCLNLITPLAISLLKIDKGLISLSNTAEAEGRVQGADKNRQKHKKPFLPKEEETVSEKRNDPPMKDKYRVRDEANTWRGNQKHMCKSYDASQEG